MQIRADNVLVGRRFISEFSMNYPAIQRQVGEMLDGFQLHYKRSLALRFTYDKHGR